MVLEVGHSYKLAIKIKEKILTYTCKVISIDEIFVSFIDKFGNEYNYNKNLIIGFEPIEEVKND